MRQSPKYSATLYSIGHKKQGLDGNMWIVTSTVKGVKRWAKEEERDKLEKILDKKLYKWWSELSNGNFIVVFKNGTHKLYKSKKKTQTAQIKENVTAWKEYGKNKDVVAIIWSSMSVDYIQGFIKYLLYKIPKAELKKLVDNKNLPNYLIKNYKKYFYKDESYTDKDYLLKNYYPH